MDPELLAALRLLSSRQRAALWLRYCDDLATADVARIMGCSETAAKQLLLRARDSLRARLASRLKEDLR
jgi:RNA polymerase sigma factor (sigma-70 family)